MGQETRSGYAIDTKHVKTEVLVENGVARGVLLESGEKVDADYVVLTAPGWYGGLACYDPAVVQVSATDMVGMEAGSAMASLKPEIRFFT